MKTNLYDIMKDLDAQKEELRRDGWTFHFIAAKTGSKINGIFAGKWDDLVTIVIEGLREIYDTFVVQDCEMARKIFEKHIKESFQKIVNDRTLHDEKRPDRKS